MNNDRQILFSGSIKFCSSINEIQADYLIVTLNRARLGCRLHKSAVWFLLRICNAVLFCPETEFMHFLYRQWRYARKHSILHLVSTARCSSVVVHLIWIIGSSNRIQKNDMSRHIKCKCADSTPCEKKIISGSLCFNEIGICSIR